MFFIETATVKWYLNTVNGIDKRHKIQFNKNIDILLKLFIILFIITVFYLKEIYQT